MGRYICPKVVDDRPVRGQVEFQPVVSARFTSNLDCSCYGVARILAYIGEPRHAKYIPLEPMCSQEGAKRHEKLWGRELRRQDGMDRTTQQRSPASPNFREQVGNLIGADEPGQRLPAARREPPNVAAAATSCSEAVLFKPSENVGHIRWRGDG